VHCIENVCNEIGVKAQLSILPQTEPEFEPGSAGFRGYGMMLAEIGLPPGFEIDRESLETARETGSIQGYEVQPDRIVFYVWPEAGIAANSEIWPR
jgi:hypothetical protein